MADALTNNRWIRDIDHNMTQQIIVEFLELWDKLENVVLIQSQEGRITWLHSSNGQYSAKSPYSLQFEGLTRCSTAELTWKTKVPPKCKFFIWVLLQDRVWTAARLQLREWPNEYFCQLCICNLETATHLFVDCLVVKAIWERVVIWVRTPCLQPSNWDQTENVNDWFLQLVNGIPAPVKEGMKSLVMLVIWEVWRERNRRVFMNECMQIQQVMEATHNEAKAWAYAGNNGLQQVMPMQSHQEVRLDDGHNPQLAMVNGVVVFFPNVN